MLISTYVDKQNGIAYTKRRKDIAQKEQMFCSKIANFRDLI